MMKRTGSKLWVGVLALSVVVLPLAAQSGRTRAGRSDDAMTPASIRQWLTVIASDEFEGRNTFSEGLGLAAAYIADQLREAGVKPGGDRGSYFQRVPVLGVRSTNRSTVTVEISGQSRTFENGKGITFPANVGGPRTVTVDAVEFVGYGLKLDAGHDDYRGVDVKGKAVVWLGVRGPSTIGPQQAARLLRGRTSTATEDMGAAAAIGPVMPPFPGAPGNRDRAPNGPDFTTAQRLDTPVTPAVSGSDEFFEFLFSGSSVKYADLKAKADSQEPLAPFRLDGVRLTFRLDADYSVVSTQYTRNVVGIVEGRDPALRDSYVTFGAHYDHVGYAIGPLDDGRTDRISNGADDDGSGTAALIGVARAFALGPKTQRSLMFVWHSGEERGLYGSRYMADYSTVPPERIAAQLNMDMVGRNRDNKDSEADTVYVVGSDRISTELHNLLIDANENSARPLRLDYELNDPADPERIYYRSDHYSYAVKGIPVIFLTTGLHPDYHRVTDSVEKINFDKLSRIARLVHDLGRQLANAPGHPARDFKGPRMGKGSSGKLTVR